MHGAAALCNNIQNFGLDEMFLKEIFYARLHLLDEKYSKSSNIVKYYYSLKSLFSILMYFKI